MPYPEGIEWEILVVNNNSRDNTKEAVEKFTQGGRLNLRYFEESQQGKYFALNIGITKIQGEIIAFTDDNIIVDKHWLQNIKNAVDKYTDYKCLEVE